MFFTLRTIVFVQILWLASSAPSRGAVKRTRNAIEEDDGHQEPRIADAEVEKSLDQYLHTYYDRFVRPDMERKLQEKLGQDEPQPKQDIYEQMMGDQPAPENGLPFGEDQPYFFNITAHQQNVERNASSTNNQYDAIKKRFGDNSRLEERMGDLWTQEIKKYVLQATGRSNLTASRKPIEDIRIPTSNITDIIRDVYLNSSNILSDDQITEKIRSFYPACVVPTNVEQDMFKDEFTMNLYFNFDDLADEKNVNIATAILRLYRMPENATKLVVRSGDCEVNSTEEEKLIRVSIYWYTKSRKRRVKRRLSDSKVIAENSKWVELSVKPATKAWSKGRNLGLGVLVEDQDGNALKADKYFKGPSCMVGTSTPKPIPTIISDAVQKRNEPNRIPVVHGRNATTTVYSDILLLPIMDVCTLEFPNNNTHPPHISNLRINACNLKKMHDQAQKLVEKERLERLITLPLPENFQPRHIRHQRQHNKISTESGGVVDSRVILTKKQLENLGNLGNFFNTTVNDR